MIVVYPDHKLADFFWVGDSRVVFFNMRDHGSLQILDWITLDKAAGNSVDTIAECYMLDMTYPPIAVFEWAKWETGQCRASKQNTGATLNKKHFSVYGHVGVWPTFYLCPPFEIP